MSNFLEKILAHKRQEVAKLKKKLPLAQLRLRIASTPFKQRSFKQALEKAIHQGQVAIIAEIKRASPSAGILRQNVDPKQLAKNYEKHGATCISLLTDKHFFKGKPEDLAAVKSVTTLPILRKDFILDPYQIWESKKLECDAILLIVAALTDKHLKKYYELARELALDVLVEVHDEEELKRALALNPPLIGINNRNLNTFSVDLNTTRRLLPKIPKGTIVVSESGIRSTEEIKRLHNAGVHAFLIGEALMRAKNPAAKINELKAGSKKRTRPTMKPAALMGLRHVALCVVKLEACVAFYTHLLGFKITWQPDQDNVYLTSGSDNLALHRGPKPSGVQRLDHIGFLLAEEKDVDDWYQFLKEKGVTILQAPWTHRDGSRSFYCQDPDGNTLQMIKWRSNSEPVGPNASLF